MLLNLNPATEERIGAVKADSESRGVLDIKERAIRGGRVSVFAQAARFVLRTGSTVIMARLLAPEEFGLVGMVMVVTGFLSVFKDGGLSSATVQRSTVTHDQISTLFWINLAVGLVLTALSIACAPLVAAFYGEPRLFWVTVTLGLGFLFSAMAAQHQALLEREMRFGALAAIEIVSLLAGIVVGVAMAVLGFRYWALVGMTVSVPVATVIGTWMATRWVPGAPCRKAGVRSMLCFGGILTANKVIVYLAYNVEKILLGRFWGAEALGFYGRAYQLITIPADQLDSTVGWVAFPALSRVQQHPQRLKSFFLQGYRLVVSLIIPVAVACALFAPDLVFLVLGPKWNKAADIFRFLAPMILARGLINPFAWLLLSTGRTGRSVGMAVVISLTVIVGYLIGLGHGPAGVAIGYSAMMMLLIAPMIIWATHGTPVPARDVFGVIRQPLISGLFSGLAGWIFVLACGNSLSPFIRVALGGSIFLVSYAGILLVVMGQKTLYMELFRNLVRPSGTARPKRR